MGSYPEMDLIDFPFYSQNQPDYVSKQITQCFIQRWPQLYGFLDVIEDRMVDAHLWKCSGLLGG